MQQELQKLIKELFDQYQNYQNLINALIAFVIVISNILVGFFISRSIEKYKHKNSLDIAKLNSDLSLISKQTEIRFKEHYESQIKSIKLLYEKFVNIEYSTKSLLKEEFESSPHEELRGRITNWYKFLMDLHIFYNRNRIIFPDKIKMQFGNILSHFENINKYLSSANKSLAELEAMYNGEFQYMYECAENEEDKIISRIKELKKKDEFKFLEQTFSSFRKLLEKEYKNVTI